MSEIGLNLATPNLYLLIFISRYFDILISKEDTFFGSILRVFYGNEIFFAEGWRYRQNSVQNILGTGSTESFLFSFLCMPCFDNTKKNIFYDFTSKITSFGFKIPQYLCIAKILHSSLYHFMKNSLFLPSRLLPQLGTGRLTDLISQPNHVTQLSVN